MRKVSAPIPMKYAVVTPETEVLPPLFNEIVLSIFSRVDLMTRMRCACVSRSWRKFCVASWLWTNINFTVDLTYQKIFSCGLLSALSAKADGKMRHLNVRGSCFSNDDIFKTVRDNEKTLETLRINIRSDETAIKVMKFIKAAAAPQLCVVADVFCSKRVVRALLNTHGIQVDSLVVDFTGGRSRQMNFAADLFNHSSLKVVWLWGVRMVLACFEATIDAAVRNQWTTLSLYFVLKKESVPALSRLLTQDKALTSLTIHSSTNCSREVFNVDNVLQFCDALKKCTLEKLCLKNVSLFKNITAGTLILGALSHHETLTDLRLSLNRWTGNAAACAGVAFAALIYSPRSRITHLEIDGNDLCDIGMRFIADALAKNTTLMDLNCSCNGMSRSFIRDEFTPMCMAHKSLKRVNGREPHQFTLL